MAKQENQTGSCRFCGQTQSIVSEERLTEPQLEEQATMQCECDEALAYKEAANRRQVAKQRVTELFGEGAGEYRQPEAVINAIMQSVDLVCDKATKQIVFTIRTGLHARIMQMAKDKIKVVRESSNSESYEQ